MDNKSFWGRLIPTAILFALTVNPVGASTTLPLPSGSEVALARSQGAPQLCSSKPAVDLDAIGNSHRISGQDDLIIRSWFACLTQQPAAINASLPTSGDAVATASTLTALLGQQAQVAANLVGISAHEQVALYSAATYQAQTNATVNAAATTTKICNIISYVQSGVSTVLTASLNANSTGEKITDSIINLGLGILSPVVGCNNSATNKAGSPQTAASLNETLTAQ
jgi:hypothetical protein